MTVRIRHLIPITIVALSGLLPAHAQDSLMAKVTRGPFPDWVKSREIDYTANVPKEKIRDGMWWLHTEVQLHYPKAARFARYAKKITSSTGVERNGKIVITFDPQCQTLCLNRVHIRRGDNVLDRTQTQEIHFFGKRDSRELKLYDNRVRATLILHDLRIDDIVEYAYTITGNNPVLQGVYSKRFYANSNKFIRRSYLRLLWPRGKPLKAKNYGRISPPTQTTLNDLTEVEWAEQDLDPPPLDDGVPGSCFKYRMIDLTECESWAALAQWAANLFAIKDELPDTLRKLIAEIANEPTPEAQALKALRYVQMKVRYLYMGLGPHMVQPYPIKTIWARRFGDCKDKTKLLCTILRKLGIEATPVFVNTLRKKSMAKLLPSTRAFTHVITRIRINDKTYWVDPTRTHQGGTLATNYFPPYGWGLVLDGKTTKLTPIPGQALDLATSDVVENYRIPDAGPTQFDITWSYTGRDADYMRKIAADKGIEEVQRRYVSNLMGRHPDATVVGKMAYHDDETANKITVKIAFQTTDMWAGEDRCRRLYPISLSRSLNTPKMAVRTLPYRIRYPNNYTYTINVQLPRKSRQYPAAGRITHPAFEYTYKHQMVDDLNMRLHHAYQARSEVVEAADMDDFRKKMNEVERGFCYDLYEPGQEPVAAQPSPPDAADKAQQPPQATAPQSHVFGLCMLGLGLLGAGMLIGYRLGTRVSRQE